MVNAYKLEDVLAMALRLAPKERLRLIEQVAASVEQDISAVSESSSPEHWGQALNRLIDSLEPVEMIHPEIDDPVSG